jgi:hypothetical protein
LVGWGGREQGRGATAEPGASSKSEAVQEQSLQQGVPKEEIALKCLAVPILVEGVARGLPNLPSNWEATDELV